ncbi:BadF/BadG/BcrA/BcrD ATPase family protein [Alteromonas sp. ASW11-36]|uniref:BadF/BadG/BcrA/BcrD ATPase family protein n=1 Tax=Alteromonas arenosi TaxID=3055817 RepID=A0ABT7T0A4_9ALTE|nr:BadF/BadG/BcrA/BcrD ATPase family protein [Alteromonas sp. ASW11-36]MDM7861876.1 BadF/BadG/BcrA/BcrD ATPase family protein [Alteromonas sp. ASW11-36]
MVEKIPLFVGVDGGGTTCRARVFDEHLNELGHATAGAANIARNTESVLNEIAHVIHASLQDAKIPTHQRQQYKIHVCAGLAGFKVRAAQHALQMWQHPYQQLSVTTDLTAAIWGGHNGHDGSALIVGTGSCAAAKYGETITQIGGHGFVLGDKGSGAWLGKKALQVTLLSLEQYPGAVPRDFSQAIIEVTGCQTAEDIVSQFNNAQPADFARLAPALFELAPSQKNAAALISEGAEYLSVIATQALELSGGNLCLAGGLAESYRSYLDPSLITRIQPPQQGAEYGAVLWAKSQA